MTQTRFAFAGLFAFAVVATGCGDDGGLLPDAQILALDAARSDARLIDAPPSMIDAPISHVDATMESDAASTADAAVTIDAPRSFDAAITIDAPRSFDAAITIDAPRSFDAEVTVDAARPIDAAPPIDAAIDAAPDAIAAPTITSIIPNIGLTTGNQIIAIHGTNLSTIDSVTFGGIAGTNVSASSDSVLTVFTPARDIGTVDIEISGPGGSVTAPGGFLYELGQPTLTSIAPATGDVAGGTSIEIVGTNFSADTAVFFGTVAAISVVVNSETSLTVIAPAGSGIVDIAVVTDFGSTVDAPSDQYTYTDFASVTSVSPAGGPSTGGTEVTISGVNFASASAVTFGTVAAESFDIVNDTTITATAPADALGTVDVEVTNDEGTSPDVETDQFTYVTLPTVHSLSPNVVGAHGQTLIHVGGTGFTNVIAVFMGTTSVSFTIISDTSLTFTTPSEGDSSFHITVETEFVTSATSANDVIQFVN